MALHDPEATRRRLNRAFSAVAAGAAVGMALVLAGDGYAWQAWGPGLAWATTSLFAFAALSAAGVTVPERVFVVANAYLYGAVAVSVGLLALVFAGTVPVPTDRGDLLATVFGGGAAVGTAVLLVRDRLG